LEHYQIEYSFYSLDDNLLPDWTSLKDCDFGENDIFLLVYYFGFPMGIPDAMAFCRDKKLLLIEDCAHSIVKEIVPGGIGTHGAGAIFGLRKIIPVPNGGFLYMENIPVSIPPTISTSPGIYRSPFKMIAQWVLAKLGINLPASREHKTKSNYKVFAKNYSLFNFQEPISYWGKKISNSVNIDDIIQKRRNNYNLYYSQLKDIKEICIPATLVTLDDQTTPWVFFFFFQEAEWLINSLRQYQIFADDFPNLHPKVFQNTKFEKENLMYQRSVTLPVHQDLTKNEIRFTIAKVKDLLAKYSKREKQK
jgi:dTDP-4-amino-4,6-dideoxygalactose transaminase